MLGASREKNSAALARDDFTAQHPRHWTQKEDRHDQTLRRQVAEAKSRRIARQAARPIPIGRTVGRADKQRGQQHQPGG